MRFLRRVLEEVGVLPLCGGHRRDDRALALEHLLVEVGALDLLLDLAHAGQHAHQAADAAHLLHLGELHGQVFEVELALAHLLRGAERLLVVDGLGRLLDQRDDVAHAEDAVGDAGRVELLQRVDLLADADELDRLAGDGAHRERRAAAGIAVHAGEHDAGDAEPLVEGAGGVDASWPVRASATAAPRGAGSRLHLGGLGHQALVDRGAAGGVEHHHVEAAERRYGAAICTPMAGTIGRLRLDCLAARELLLAPGVGVESRTLPPFLCRSPRRTRFGSRGSGGGAGLGAGALGEVAAPGAMEPMAELVRPRRPPSRDVGPAGRRAMVIDLA